jgi:hypothetical protein
MQRGNVKPSVEILTVQSPRLYYFLRFAAGVALSRRPWRASVRR